MKKRLVITWTLIAVLFGLAANAEAVQTKTDKPFVHVSATPDEVDLGTALFLKNTYDVPGALTVNVEANCMHGPIMISATKLKNPQGGTILPESIFVKSSATEGFVPMAKPVAISKPEIGSHKIVLDLRVETNSLRPAGEYSGKLVLTIMPPV